MTGRQYPPRIGGYQLQGQVIFMTGHLSGQCVPEPNHGGRAGGNTKVFADTIGHGLSVSC